jgi:protein-tyrosine phosphatase
MSSKKKQKIKIIFVCLGNICRSPIAEAVFKKIIEEKKLASEFFIDSAGTSGYHDGEMADPRTRRVAEQDGILITHLSRKFNMSDFLNFDYIIAMDKTNVTTLNQFARTEEERSKIKLFREFESGSKEHEVPDPYYGNTDSFIQVQKIVKIASNAFLSFLIDEHQISSIE